MPFVMKVSNVEVEIKYYEFLNSLGAKIYNIHCYNKKLFIAHWSKIAHNKCFITII